MSDNKSTEQINTKLNKVTKKLNKMIKNSNKQTKPKTMYIKFRPRNYNKKKYINRRSIIPRSIYNSSNIYKELVYKYVNFILNPSLSNRGYDIPKLPNMFNVPTSTARMVDTHMVTANGSGNLLITWKPGFLSTEAIINEVNEKLQPGWKSNFTQTEKYWWSNITLNNNSNLDGQTINNNNGYLPCPMLNMPVSRYRLISAELKLTYIGANDTIAGKYLGCVSYNDSHVMSGVYSGNPTCYDSTLNDFTIFSNITNGLYSVSTPLTSTKRTVRTIFIPTDSVEKQFRYIGQFYDAEVGKVYNTSNIAWVQQRTESGAQMSHILAVEGGEPNGKYSIDIVYNYEVVSSTSGAHLLYGGNDHNEGSDMMESAYNTASNLVSNYTKINGVVEPVLETMNNIGKGGLNLGTKLISGYNTLKNSGMFDLIKIGASKFLPNTFKPLIKI